MRHGNIEASGGKGGERYISVGDAGYMLKTRALLSLNLRGLFANGIG